MKKYVLCSQIELRNNFPSVCWMPIVCFGVPYPLCRYYGHKQMEGEEVPIEKWLFSLIFIYISYLHMYKHAILYMAII